MICGLGFLGERMDDTFMARSLTGTRTVDDDRRFEMTFVDAGGQTQTISLPVGVAADLITVLQSLVAAPGPSRIPFTKVPKSTAVGSARHDRLVLVRFDDDPPYALHLEEAENLWRGIREQAEEVAIRRAPVRQ